MITPKEARKKADELTFPYNMFFDDYITQQKKVTKLLELYRLKDELLEKYQVTDNILERQQTLGAITEVREEIQGIEEGLK